MCSLRRRVFLKSSLMAAGTAAFPGLTGAASRADYRKSNVVIVRFGGGVRRRETIEPEHTYAPFLRHILTTRGTLFPNMEIATAPGVETGHGEGTLNILTGRYESLQDVGDKFLGERFEASHPTLFEYLRKTYAVPAHQVLLVNGEDRTDEEFYAFSNHPRFGIEHRCSVLSLYRFKCYLLRRQIAAGQLTEAVLAEKQTELAKLEALDKRDTNRDGQGPAINAFWEGWRRHYGETGFVNPRGDRLLTEIALRAMDELKPRLMMVNYNDPDYVHWGNASHYTRGISIIDEGLRRLVERADADPFYRDNTVFVVAPDCGRDDNRFMAIPYQHHFNSKSAHEVFALLFGPGITRNQIVDRQVDQIAITATVGEIMGLNTQQADAPALGESFA